MVNLAQETKDYIHSLENAKIKVAQDIRAELKLHEEDESILKNAREFCDILSLIVQVRFFDYQDEHPEFKKTLQQQFHDILQNIMQLFPEREYDIDFQKKMYCYLNMSDGVDNTSIKIMQKIVENQDQIDVLLDFNVKEIFTEEMMVKVRKESLLKGYFTEINDETLNKTWESLKDDNWKICEIVDKFGSLMKDLIDDMDIMGAFKKLENELNEIIEDALLKKNRALKI